MCALKNLNKQQKTKKKKEEITSKYFTTKKTKFKRNFHRSTPLQLQ